jgi:hypothetical protein
MPRSSPAGRARTTRSARRFSALCVLLVVGLGAAGLLWYSTRGCETTSEGILQPVLAERPVDDDEHEREALVGARAPARESERQNALPFMPPRTAPARATSEAIATWPLRIRVAATAASDTQDLELDYGLNEIEGLPVRWHGTVALVRAGQEKVASLPSAYTRRVLALEVRSRARDLSSGVVHLGRPQSGDVVLDVTLREVGELVVVVRPPSTALGASSGRGAQSRTVPGNGGVATEAPGLDILRLAVVTAAAGGEVTAYGERICAVDRDPRPNDLSTDGGRLYERVLAGGVRVEVEELRSHPAQVDAQVARGERLVLDVPLAPLDFVGALSGTIVVEGPRIKGGINVVVRSLDDPTRTFVTVAGWTGDISVGQRHAWRIEDVPSGVYEVIPMPSSLVPVDPPTHTAEAPADGLDFIVRNESELRWCDWNVIDASSRAPLENVWVDLERRDGTLRSVRLDLSPAERFPRGSDVRWTVRCAGYESISGTLADCDRAEPRTLRKHELELADERMREVWVCDLELNPTSR